MKRRKEIIYRKADSFERFSFFKAAIILFLFQFASSRMIESYYLKHPDILSMETANLLINYVMHGGVLLLALLILRYYRISIRRMAGPFSLKSSHLGKWIGYELLIFLITITFLLTLVNVILRLMSPEELIPFILTQETSLESPISTFPMYLLTFTLAPLMEEVVFRGILLNKWGEKMSWKWAVFLSSFVFALLHFKLFLPQFLLGILYSLVYLRTDRLSVPIVLHALHNFLLGFLTFFSTSNDSANTDTSIAPLLFDIPQEIFGVLNVGTVFFLVLLFVVLLLFKRQIRQLPEETPYQRNSK